MRFDLTVNEFTKEMALGNELVIYDAHTWRPYCHTEDFAYLICEVIEADIVKVAFEIFNVGDNENNFTKQMIVDEILKFYPNGKVKYLEKGVDERNYIVDFSKVNSVLDFKPKYTIKKGIEELIDEINKNSFDFKSNNQFGNYTIKLLN
jgi:nucleoside-diphosphate-sugar epimerase